MRKKPKSARPKTSMLGLLITSLILTQSIAIHLLDAVESSRSYSFDNQNNRLLIDYKKLQINEIASQVGPNIELNTSYAHQNNLTAHTSSDPVTLTLDITQPLYQSSLYQNIKLADLEEKKAEFIQLQEQERSDLSVINHYLNAAMLYQLVDLLNIEEKLLQTLQTKADLSSKLGVSPKHESSLAQADWLQQKNKILQTQDNIAFHTSELERTTGLPITQIYRLSDHCSIFSQTAPSDVKELINNAFMNNPQQNIHHTNVALAEQSLESKKAEYNPTLLATGKIQKQLGQSNLSRTNTSASLNLTASLPIYTHGEKQASLEQKANLIKRADLSEQNSQKKLTNDILLILRNLKTNQQRIEILEQSQVARQLAYDTVYANYESGFSSLTDILREQKILFETRYEALETKYQHLSNYIKLYQLLGELDNQTIQAVDDCLTQQTNLTLQN